MGAVYRARDTQLDRTVALKILPDAFAADPERVKRFEREAKALAALNHQNIAHVYGLVTVPGEAGAPDRHAIVMEYVDGQDLTVRLGRLSVGEALRLAGQIAEALEAAHGADIIHRDLKPANVRVTPAGVVKVLDFGIAKSQPDESAGDPTVTLPTAPGVALGTPGYMSPEQLRGQAVDTRTDIWAFGCVLFEMLAGQRAFAGKTGSDAVAATLEREPDWALLPRATPAVVAALLRRCLQKDPARRLRDIGDARFAIEDAISQPGASESGSGGQALHIARWVLASLALAGLAALGTWFLVRPAGGEAVDPGRVDGGQLRFEIETLADEPLNVSTTTPTIALSPDGRRVAYVSARAGQSGGALVVRNIGDLTPRVVAGPTWAREPFFSPDGLWLGYLETTGSSGLKTVPVAGGEPRVVVPSAQVEGAVRAGAWMEDGTIVFSTTDEASGLLRVSENGGTPSVLTTPDRDAGEADHLFPSPLPDGRGVLFTVTRAPPGDPAVAVYDVQAGAHKILVPGAACARYDARGFLVYAASGTLFAAPMDLERLAIVGEPIRLVERVLMGAAGCAYFATSGTGALAYVPAAEGDGWPGSLVWVERGGAEHPVAAPPRAYRDVRLSPDGSKVAVSILAEDRDIWTWDFHREVLTRVTSGPDEDRNPVWTPDGARLVFASGNPRTLYLQSADGSGAPERLTTMSEGPVPSSTTLDGRYVVGHQLSGGRLLFRMALGRPHQTESIFDLRGSAPAVSPNERFVAYISSESNSPQVPQVQQVWVRPFPRAGDARWQVSPAGGRDPKWSRNGRELFYRDASDRIVSVPVDTSGPTLDYGPPVIVVPQDIDRMQSDGSRFDVSPDGTRFLMVRRLPPRAGRIVVWLNALAKP